jgi:hypothetical protein
VAGRLMACKIRTRKKGVQCLRALLPFWQKIKGQPRSTESHGLAGEETYTSRSHNHVRPPARLEETKKQKF